MRNLTINVLSKLLFVGLLLVCVVDVFSQSHLYKTYGVEDGLPSSEVYSAFQDSKGYMWFATDAGVSRFNGYEFENFDASDGLTDNTVFLITEDSKGRIWFGTFNYQLSYYEEGVIYPYEFNDVLFNDLTEKRAMSSFYVDSNKTIWLGLYSEGIYKLDSNGKGGFLEVSEKDYWKMKMIYVEDEIIYGVYEGRVFQRERLDGFLSGMKCYWEYTPKKRLLNKKGEFIFQKKGDIVYSFGVVRHDGKVVLFLCDQMITLDDERLSSNVKTEISWLKNEIIYSLISIDGYLWICVRNKGVYKCEYKNDSLKVVEHLLPNESVSRIFKDRQKGYWFLTLNKGVVYLSNDEIGHYENDVNLIESIEIDSVNGIFFKSYNDGSITKESLEDERWGEEVIAETGKIIFNSCIKYNYFDGSLLAEKYYYLNGKWTTHKDKDSLINIISKSFLIDSNRIYKASDFGLSIIEKNKEIFYSYKEGVSSLWCTSLVKVGDDVWIGTKDGIRIYANEKMINPFSDNQYLSTAITSLAKLNDDVVLIGTKSFGLLVVKNDSVVSVIDKSKGLVSDLIRTIHIDNQNDVWLGTNKGICKLTFTTINDFELKIITQKHGLISAEIKDIESYKNMIYAVTAKGLVQFDKTKIEVNSVPPSVFISKFKVNEKEKELTRDNEFSHIENNVNIVFEALNYRSRGTIEYQYRMLGVDTNWITTTTRDVRYPALHFGDYKFQVKAKNEDGVWSENPTSLSFCILPPFWFTWWFITLTILFIIVTVGVVFFEREKNIIKKNEQAKNKSETEKRIIDLELRALRSQMNPHFIFNILNSIQHYIIVNDFRSINKYISSFAKLIRTVLHLSEKSMITIQEELDMLNLYMNLEKMRFDEQFSFEIDVSKDIDVNYDEIPSMLIQPYIENSIWHGLMNKTKKGEIKIKLYLIEDYLCCSIQDNGIGREKANKIKERREIGQKSVGMSITKERLDIFSDNDVNIIVTDLADDFGNALGTKVQIRIPYKN